TGASGPLSCGALGAPAAASIGRLLERCALQIGPARGHYTTPESVADIEALRRAASYERLVLYGTSYGTKVALQYAPRYPAHVEALLLDSVVPPHGPEPLALPTFRAMPAVRSALRGDPGPLVRLHLLSLGLIPSVPRVPVENSPPIDEALFAATSCEEMPFPWQRASPPATRLAEARAAVRALPSADFYPF